jgi:hypothetical protein
MKIAPHQVQIPRPLQPHRHVEVWLKSARITEEKCDEQQCHGDDIVLTDGR